MSPELLHLLEVLIGTIGAKGIAELIQSWRLNARLKNVERLLESLPAVASQIDSTQKELAALNVRVGVLEDMGPVLR